MTKLTKGISLYPGLGRPLEENLRRLEEAAELGITRLFLSFHIPETDPAAFDREVEPLLRRARSLGLETVGDLVPGRPVPENLTFLRLDDGYTPEAMAALQKKYPDRTLVLNASALTEDQLETWTAREWTWAGCPLSTISIPIPIPVFLKNICSGRTGCSTGTVSWWAPLRPASPGNGARLGKDFPPWNKPGTGVCPWLPGSWRPWGLTESISGMTDRTGRNWRPWPGFRGGAGTDPPGVGRPSSVRRPGRPCV